MPTYHEALNYIYSFTDLEKKTADQYAPEHFDLARMERLLDLLGNPHHRFQAVHVAGSKGKGSTAAMIESILRAAGYPTGLYTSPHLHTFRERIQAHGQLIPQEDVVAGIEKLKPLAEKIERLSTFEIMTALAFAWFAEQGAELAVLEVGLGGRLDATNVVTPLVSVITSISYDHTAILGHTLPAIAREKAGIVKPGVPVVCATQNPEARPVIEEVCRDRGAPLILVGRDWAWRSIEASLRGQTFTAQATSSQAHDEYRALHIPLLGQHQLVNATAALAAVEILRSQGLAVPRQAVRRGLRRVCWPGRLEVLNRQPLLVVDGAHNADSARQLAVALRQYFRYQHLLLLFGASADKDIAGMLRELLPLAHEVIVTRARHARAADPAWLAGQVRVHGWEPIVTSEVGEALERALGLSRGRDLICATGSLFVVADAREVWLSRTGKQMPPRD